MLIKNMKKGEEPRYEAPAIAVGNMQDGGVLCASTQMFDEEEDATGLFKW